MAILAGVVVFAFLLGRITAGGGTPSNTASLQTKINQLTSQNSQLQTALQASNSGTSTGTNTGGTTVPTPSTSVATSPSPSASSTTVGPNGTTYTVKAGDSLSAIEARFYRTIGEQYTQAIEAANGMTSSAIHVGQTLTIPPASAATNPSTATSPTPPVTVTTPAATHPTPSSTKR